MYHSPTQTNEGHIMTTITGGEHFNLNDVESEITLNRGCSEGSCVTETINTLRNPNFFQGGFKRDEMPILGSPTHKTTVEEPHYEADDGALSEEQLAEIRSIVGADEVKWDSSLLGDK